MNDKSKFAKELGPRNEKDELTRSKPIASTQLVPRRRESLELAVAVRRQTRERHGQYNTALDAVLAEWVRQHLEAEGRPL